MTFRLEPEPNQKLMQTIQHSPDDCDEIVRLLSRQDKSAAADANYRDGFLNETVLQSACKKLAGIETIQILLEYGADPKDIKVEDPDVANLLKQYRKHTNKTVCNPQILQISFIRTWMGVSS